MGRKMQMFGNNYFVVANAEIIFILDTRLNFQDIKILKVPLTKIKEEKLETIPTSERYNLGSSYIGISVDNKYLAVATENKALFVWSIENWEMVKREALLKRPVGVVFSHDSSKVLVADKAGDVYSFCVSGSYSLENKTEGEQPVTVNEDSYSPDEESGPEPLLGHLSMLLDIVISRDGKYLITCDRDEKIRVSCYPNCYNIHTFCLGHEEFVSHIQLVPSSDSLLLSCSGDGTVRLWNYLNGSCLDLIDAWPKVEHYHKKITNCKSDKKHCEEMECKSLLAITKLDLYQFSESEFIIVLLINRLPILLFYILRDKKFGYYESFNIADIPLDVLFLSSSELLVLCDSENSSSNPLKVLKISKESKDCVSEMSSHPLLNFGEKYKEELNVDGSCMSDMELLYKQRYDNVAEYLKRKEERLGLLSSDSSKKEKNPSTTPWRPSNIV